MRTIDDALSHLRTVFLGMPGLRITPEQVRRLCGIEWTMCKAALVVLVDEKFLRVTVHGSYVRAADGVDHPGLDAATADPETTVGSNRHRDAMERTPGRAS